MKTNTIITTVLILLLVGCAKDPSNIIIPEFKPVVGKEAYAEPHNGHMEMPVSFEATDRARTPRGCEEARLEGADC